MLSVEISQPCAVAFHNPYMEYELQHFYCLRWFGRSGLANLSFPPSSSRKHSFYEIRDSHMRKRKVHQYTIGTKTAGDLHARSEFAVLPI